VLALLASNGVIARSGNQTKEVIQTYIDPMQLTPEEALKRGFEAQKEGDLLEARKFYVAILKANPKHPEANHNLGVIALKVGKKDEAVQLFKAAVDANSGLQQFWVSYIDALIKTEKPNEALKALAEAEKNGIDTKVTTNLKARLRGDPPESAKNHGNSKRDAERYVLEGNDLKAARKFDKALALYQKALKIMPNSIAILNNIAATEVDLTNYQKAIDIYNEAIQLDPDIYYLYNNRGTAYRMHGNEKAALENYQAALKRNPDSTDTLNNIANIYRDLGEKDKAISIFEEVLRKKPDHVGIHRNLANLKTYDGSEPQIKKLLELYGNDNLPPIDRAALCFSLGKVFEDLEDYKASFGYYEEANRLHKREIGYAISKDSKIFELIKKKFSEPADRFMQLVAAATSQQKQPVFVLGMPRSGTTLIEQILGSHSQVFAAGELNDISNGLRDSGLLEIAHSAEGFAELRTHYLDSLERFSASEPLITDKMPLNFRFIGYILTAIPEARVVNVIRDPVATCWSNFKRLYNSGGNQFSYNLKDLGTYYNMYVDLMKFWHDSFPGKIHDIDYDLLTRDPEYQSRNLLESLSLEWEEQCLEFHKSKRAVRTASNLQVRQEIYTGSSQQWKPYEPFLNELLDTLNTA